MMEGMSCWNLKGRLSEVTSSLRSGGDGDDEHGDDGNDDDENDVDAAMNLKQQYIIYHSARAT